jgi:hypothetical protein
MSPAACRFVRLVDRHFAAHIRPVQERILRAHVADCVVCRDRYSRHLLLARLDPRVPSTRDRLARGLGLRDRPPRGRWRSLAVVGLAAAGALALWPRPVLERKFTARGVPAAFQAVVVYRVNASGGTLPAGSFIGASDELAFAYRNPAGRKFLLVFGTDEHRRVYWYHPAWTDATEDPVAVPIRPTSELVELPEAISQRIEGSTLTIHTLLLDQPVRVREVEERLARGTAPLIAGAQEEALSLEVRK